MVELESYFDSTEMQVAHPFLKKLDVYLSEHAGATASVKVERERQGLSYAAAKLAVLARSEDGTLRKRISGWWDNELNQELVRRGYKAVDHDNETLRLMLSLRASLQRVEVRYGDGIFNSVVVAYVLSSPFARLPRVAGVLSGIRRAPPRDTEAYRECSDMIDAIIRSKGHDLRFCLGYDLEPCEEILSGAIAQYLDERFSVSNRKLLGWA
ncbi:MAG: hypothetical protein ACLQVD_18105 [Capsulimonadaceae bacterium]